MWNRLFSKRDLLQDATQQPTTHPAACYAEEALPEIARFPTHLPGSFWGITTYFNPAGYKNKTTNLERFCEAVRAQGLKLMIVELTFEGQTPVIRDDLADLVVRRHSRSVMFLKENLINIGVAALPADCDKVAWLDGDVLFENANWVQDTAARLERYHIVQPFSEACWLHPGQTWAPRDYFKFGHQEGHSMHGLGAGLATVPRTEHAERLTQFMLHGHTGFGWAARRKSVAKHGLYAHHILGHGDVVFSQALFGNHEYWRTHRYAGEMPGPLSEHQTRWSRDFFETIQGSVSFTPGRVFHLWHGTIQNRHYGSRFQMLVDYSFHPEQDLALDAQGNLVWNTSKTELIRKVEAYFRARKEES